MLKSLFGVVQVTIFGLATLLKIRRFTTRPKYRVLTCSPLRLTKDYYSKLPSIDNEYTKAISGQDEIAAPRQLVAEYVAPPTFMYCDKMGLVPDSNNVPLIYHWRRNKANKRIAVGQNRNIFDTDKYKYSTVIPSRDYYDFRRLNFK